MGKIKIEYKKKEKSKEKRHEIKCRLKYPFFHMLDINHTFSFGQARLIEPIHCKKQKTKNKKTANSVNLLSFPKLNT